MYYVLRMKIRSYPKYRIFKSIFKSKISKSNIFIHFLLITYFEIKIKKFL